MFIEMFLTISIFWPNCKQLLEIILTRLPETESDCKRLSPEIVKGLQVFVGLIFSYTPVAVKEHILKIIMSQEEKHIWFLENFSAAFSESIMSNIE